MTGLLLSNLDFIYFVYGLGFFLLFPICLFLHRRPPSSLPWMWLLLFGITHGTLEWLDLAALSLGTDYVFALVRIGLLILSFLFMAEFGRAGLVMLRGRGPGRWVLAVLLGLALLGAFAGLPGVRASSRYALGLVGALGAAAALWVAARRLAPGRRALQGGAFCLAGYAVAAGLVVAPAPFFPASWLNTEAFLAAVGVPIQLVRGFLAASLSVFLSSVAWTLLGQEKHHRLQKWGRNLTVGTMVGVLFLVTAGWFLTHHFGYDAAMEIRSGQKRQGQVLQLVLSDKMAEADLLMTALVGSPATISYLASRTRENRDRTHALLDRYSASLPGSIMYVMDREGLTIASSNRGAPDSFLGKSYGFRPYFRQALQGAKGNYFALGVTSGKLGYYTSSPVRDGRDKIIGVAVIKRTIEDLEGFFPKEGLTLIIDGHGIVVLANRPDLVLKSLWPLSAAVREQLTASRQFGPGPFAPIMAQMPEDGGDCQFQGRRYLVMRQTLPFQKWSTVILSSKYPIGKARLQALGIAIFSCLVVLSLLTIIGLTIESTSRVQRSENRFRQLYGNLRDGSVLVDMSGNIAAWNPAFQAMLGYPPEELPKLSLLDLAPQTRQEKDARIIADQVLSRGYSDLYEQEYRRRDGSLLPVEIQAYLIQEDEDQPAGMWVFVRDITERIRLEEARRTAHQELQAIIQASPLSIFVLDPEGKVVLWNPASEKTFGWTEAEAVGCVLPIVPEDKMEEFRDNLGRALNGELLRDLEANRRRKDGTSIDIRIYSSTLYDPQGKATGVMAVMTDITEWKRAEEEKAKLEAQLLQAQKMEAIGTLAGGIAHDFNNILGAISGFTELTLQAVPRRGQEQYNLDQVLKAVERARDLVKQILVFSRRAALTKRPLQVRSVVKETLKLLRASLPTTIEIKENLGATSAMILSDPTQVNQILMNLGANAAHAMRENGGLLEVNLEEVTLGRGDRKQHPDLTPGPYVKLTVRDTGKGMDQAIIGRLFEPFFTTKEVGEGTGMGLAVVHGIVKSSGGEITVSSRPGAGTTFTILLPKITGEVTTASTTPAPLPTGNDSILFIDDEEMLVNITKEMLKKLGYQVVAQTSSLEALKIFQAQPEKFDLIITDQTMPHLTGMQLAQEFRHIRPDIPIILCTGYSENLSAENIKAANITDILTKPFIMRILAETIRKVLD